MIEVTELHPAFNTCNIFYSRELLERVGGFDTDAFQVWGGEDCDLAWRAIDAGGEPVFEPGALVHHAVDHVGPGGMLRVAARWTSAMQAYARHPGLRRGFTYGVFWKREHYLLTRAVLALVPRLPWPIRALLAYPYARSLWSRRQVFGGGPALAPFCVAIDLTETMAVTRGGIRYRRLML